MGWGALIEEAVSAAESDMSRVQAAAEAINTAIGKARPLLTSGTWKGPPATAWIGDWNGFYKSVQSMLGGLPAAESAVVSKVQTDMEAQARKHSGQPVPS
ncbi:MAG: hypothetical protein J2P32_09745 [Actinobacteria bacterium]|nr:hypothetical protein [Actinomycetota bacterium]